MGDEWPTMTLQEAHVVLIDCDHRTPPATDKGFPYVAIPQLRYGRIDLSGVRRITREHYIEWTRKARPSEYDVILSRRCNPGETAVVPPNLEFALGQNLVLLRADGTKVHPPFLRWLVRGSEWWEQISKFINVGAVFDSLKCADIPRFKLHIPPLPEQRAIAHILGSLDDKIDLNRRMNQTLEQMAQAIFKSWFIDFDGQTEFEDSELGAVPVGWRVSRIDEWAHVVLGGTPSRNKPEYWMDGTVPWIKSGEVNRHRIHTPTEFISQSGLANSSTKLMPKGTIVIAITGATLGQISRLEIEACANQSVVGVYTGKSDADAYLLYWLQENVHELTKSATGGAQQHINRANVAEVQLPKPPDDIVAAWGRAVQPMLSRMATLLFGSDTLAALRDTLLPKLISGEIRVPEAERMVAKVL